MTADDPLDFHLPRHRPAQGSRAGMAALTRAQHLAGMVRDCGPDAIGAYLDNLTSDELYALTVTLAALVPIDQTPAELLDWLHHPQPHRRTA